jgi:NTP pyrophosphatase (non-canonical NTP hydrolase)
MTFSAFTEISSFNEMIGNPKGDLTAPDWDALENQMLVVQSEFNELLKAIAERDIQEVRDGTGDVTVTIAGLQHRAGIDAQADLQEINRSNMSKFCTTQVEAIHTAAKYEKLGVVVSYRHLDNGWVAVRSAKDQIGKDGKDYPKGKLLKSINYSAPVLD